MNLRTPHRTRLTVYCAAVVVLTAAFVAFSGPLSYTVVPQAQATLVVEGMLAKMGSAAPCGAFHLGAVGVYSDLTVIAGSYRRTTVRVIHGCPDLPRSDYAPGSGDVDEFRIGDHHRLTLVPKSEFTGTLVRNPGIGRPRFFCTNVTMIRATGKTK